MKITTKTSPQGVVIEYIENERTISQGQLNHYRTMIEIMREAANRRGAQQAQKRVRA